MKRTTVAQSLLGLIFAVAMPAANAAVLLQEDFNDGKFEGVGGVYTQGLGPNTEADPPFKIRQWAVVTDDTGAKVQELSDPATITVGILDWGNGDGISAEADPEIAHRILLLTGAPAWADVAIQSKIWSFNQNAGIAALVLRAAPKTKPTDPDSWYELRYTTNNSAVTPQEADSGIEPPVSEPIGDAVAGTNLRIMKVVNGKWTKLAEVDNTIKADVGLPEVFNTGRHQLTGMTMRFVAKGSVLEGWVGVTGQPLQKVLTANDSDLKAGRVGFHQYEYRPLSDDLLVEDAP